MTSLGKDEDGWTKGQMTGIGLIGCGGMVARADGGGTVARADGGASGIMVMGPPPSEGMELGINIDDLLHRVFLRFLRSV